jgi:porin
VDGGRDETSAYGGHLDYLIRLDLMRMNVLQGALVTIRAESRYGDTVNLEAGPLLPVNTPGYFPLTREIDDDLFIAVTNLKYVQFLSEQFALFVGKIDTLDGDANEFASGRGKSQFMNAQFVFNSALALRLPYSTLGGGFLFLPTENLSLSGTVMNTLDSSTTTGFEDVGDGVTAALEASFRYRMGTLPGGANLGGLYSFDQDFAQIGGELIFPPQGGLALTTEDDTWAVYGSLWQYLFVEGPADGRVDLSNGVQDLQGIGVFARVGFADEDTNPIEWTASAGLAGRGVLPSRDDDTLGLAYYYNSVQETRVGGFLGLDDHAQGLEFYYNLALTPAANLTFDVQVTDDIFPNSDTAVILGARLSLRF